MFFTLLFYFISCFVFVFFVLLCFVLFFLYLFVVIVFLFFVFFAIFCLFFVFVSFVFIVCYGLGVFLFGWLFSCFLCIFSFLFLFVSVLFFVLTFVCLFSILFFFGPCCTACGVLVLQLGVGPELLWWECQVLGAGTPENSWPQGILIGMNSLGSPHLRTKTQLHPTACKCQCWNATSQTTNKSRIQHHPSADRLPKVILT